MVTWPFGRLLPNRASSPDARPILSAAAAGGKRTAGRWGEGTSPILKQEHPKASKRSDFAWLAEEPRTLRAIEIAEVRMRRFSKAGERS
jgi:hypothetical protein